MTELPQSVPEDSSVEAVDSGTTKLEFVVIPENEVDTPIDGPVIEGKDNGLANIENASKVTDSEVEASREKTSKKKKSKNRKKSTVTTQAVNQSI